MTTNSLMTPLAPSLAVSFFKHALGAKTLAHAYVLKGRSMQTMYGLALDVAQVLNCDQPVDAATPCKACTNCNWIAQNRHPAVMTISRLSYLVSESGKDLSEDDLRKLAKKNTQQTKIKNEQIERLLQAMAGSSQYYRVIIFTDAEERSASEPSRIPPPADWQAVPGNEAKSFHLLPLTRSLFTAASANRFLKTLEEPPPKTLFFFLTDGEESLLDTIVSRCQVVPCPTAPDPASETLSEAYRSFFGQLVPQIGKNPDIYPLVHAFDSFFVGEEGLQLTQALELFQRYLWERFHGQDVSPVGFTVHRRWVEAVETAKKRLDAKVNSEQTLISLFQELGKP